MKRWMDAQSHAVCVAAAIVLSGSVAFGQAKPGYETKPATAQAAVEIKSVEGLGQRGRIKTPEYRTSVSGARVAPRDWGYVAVAYDTSPEWIDEITFQYYVLFYSTKQQQAKKEYTLLKGTVSYIDVAKGRRHIAEMFTRPVTVVRYGEIVGIAVEVLIKGEVVAVQSDGSGNLPKEWWKNPSLAVRDGLLLNRTQTPFAYVNYDDYETIK